MIRYTNFSLPAIAYVPGHTVRPSAEPLAETKILPTSLSETPAPANPFFLYGVDLYNHHFFWEAHESWETIWRLEENPFIRSLLKGLIQVSGGYLKIEQNIPAGARKLWHRSCHYISPESLTETGIEFDDFFKMLDLDNGIRFLILEDLFVAINLNFEYPLVK